MKEYSNVSYLCKFETDTPNSFGEILSQNLKSLLKVHVLISVFATLANSQVLIAAISSVIDCKELKIAQTAQNKQLFKLLQLICTYDDVFYHSYANAQQCLKQCRQQRFAWEQNST